MNPELIALLRTSYDEGAKNALLAFSEALDVAVQSGIVSDLAGVRELVKVSIASVAMSDGLR